MIVVSHEMGFSRDVADRVVYMDDGLFIEQGPPSDVFFHPKDERTIRFLRHILPEKEPEHAKELGIIPARRGAGDRGDRDREHVPCRRCRRRRVRAASCRSITRRPSRRRPPAEGPDARRRAGRGRRGARPSRHPRGHRRRRHEGHRADPRARPSAGRSPSTPTAAASTWAARLRSTRLRRRAARRGARTRRAAARPGLADACFVSDCCWRCRGPATTRRAAALLVAGRPGAESRRPEVATVVASGARELAPKLASVTIELPATLDFGDVIVYGDRVAIGVSARTNGRGPSSSPPPYGGRLPGVPLPGRRPAASGQRGDGAAPRPAHRHGGRVRVSRRRRRRGGAAPARSSACRRPTPRSWGRTCWRSAAAASCRRATRWRRRTDARRRRDGRRSRAQRVHARRRRPHLPGGDGAVRRRRSLRTRSPLRWSPGRR